MLETVAELVIQNQEAPLVSDKENYSKAELGAETLATGASLAALHRYLTLLAFRRPRRYD